MDKELDKMEFKLNGLSALYRVQPRQAVQSPTKLKQFGSIRRIISTGEHVKAPSSFTEATNCHREPTGVQSASAHRFP